MSRAVCLILGDRPGPGLMAALFALVVLLALPQTLLPPLLDRDEPRFAEASREMLQSGDYVVPTFNHAPRYAKPPLIYWCQAASMRVLGENAFAARLPSVLATAATALLLLWRGAQLGGTAAGLIAAAGFSLCFQAVQQGRVATADALMVFFVTLAVAAGGKLLEIVRGSQGAGPAERHPGRWRFWGMVLALAFAGGFLAKGPVALLPFVAILAGAWRGGWKARGALAAILLLALGLVSLWAVPAYVRTHGAFWREGLGHDVGDRMVNADAFQGHGASGLGGYLALLPYYFVLFWLSALPWSPLLVARRRALFGPGWKPDAIDAYLLLNAGLVFLVFSLMVTKLPHYTLPALPMLALFFGRRWVRAGLPPGLPLRLMVGAAVLFAALTLAVVPVLLARGVTPSPAGTLVRLAGGGLRPETRAALVDFNEPNAVWELRRKVAGTVEGVGPEQALDFLREPGPRAVLLRSATWARLAAGADPAWKVYAATGFNAARIGSRDGKLDLTLVVK